MTDIDRVLKKIGEEPATADLTAMEAEVWARIDEQRPDTQTGQWTFGGPVQILTSPAAAILIALLIGAVIGATSLQSSGAAGPMSAFSASAPYAPSTLLGGSPQ